jgi:hypothetical protein
MPENKPPNPPPAKRTGVFFDAAKNSMASIRSPGTEIAKQALSFAEQNMKAAFDHARKLVQETDLPQAMQIQSEFLKRHHKCCAENATDHQRSEGCVKRISFKVCLLRLSDETIALCGYRISPNLRLAF